MDESISCPNHLDLDLQYGSLSINHLQIKLNGSLMWLYDAVLIPLSDALRELFTTTMMPTIM